jgi:branched-chain amino acid transport system substrate-binding protein
MCKPAERTHEFEIYNQAKKGYSVNRFPYRRSIITCLAVTLMAAYASAQKSYDPGASDTEIKVGNIAPYTGWAKEYASIARAETAYFQMVNDRGGINGRKINFISLNNGSEVAKSIDLARKLVEDEKVLLIFSSIGTEGNLAIRGYLNEKKIPQLFVQSSSAVFNDPAHFLWTMGFFASYRSEGLAYAKYILRNKPAAKIAMLYSNDDTGKDYIAGVRDGLGDKASSLIVKEVSYQVSDPTLDPQIVVLKDSGADVFFNFSIGPFATRAIRAAYDRDWHPLQFIPNASLSVAAFLDPAGLENLRGSSRMRGPKAGCFLGPKMIQPCAISSIG